MKPHRLVSAGVGLIFCVVMLWATGSQGAVDFWNQIKTSQYQPVTARVLGSEAQTKLHMSGDRHGNVHTWSESRVGVLYEYSVSGVTHQSRRLFYGDYVPSGFGNPQAWKETHPEGSSIEAYYDAADPAQAVLVRGLTQEHWHGLLLRLLAVGLAGLMLSCLDKRMLDYFVALTVLSGAGSLWVMCVQGALQFLAVPALLAPLLAAVWVLLRGQQRPPVDGPYPLCLLLLAVCSAFLYNLFNL